MHQHTVYFDLTDTADDRFDRMIEGLLVALLTFAPLALGAVQAWSETVFLTLAAAMALVLAAKLLKRPDVRFIWSWTYLPIAVFLALTAIQLAPLPVGLLKLISPHTVALKTSLLSPLPGSAEHLSPMTLSFYPEATLANLRLLLGVSMVYVVTLNVVRQARQVQRLLIAITIIGAAVAVCALGHLIFGAKRIYGFVDVPVAWVVGPFVNRNHFGQFMNLSLGAAAAVLLVHVDQIHRSRRREAVTVTPGATMLNIPPIVWWLSAAVVVMGIGVFFSVSRGAVLSTVISAGVALLLAQRRGMRVKMWIMVPLTLIVAVFVIYFGFDALAARFSELRDESSGGRMQIAKDILVAWKDYPILGMGLGAFEVVYPMFDRSRIVGLASHAENEYAQVLLEGGLLGLAMVSGFVVMIGRRYAQAIRSAPSPMASAAVGLGFGVLAILLQSFTDFGQHIPANAALTAVSCALLVTLAQASRQTKAAEPRITAGRRAPRLASTVVVAAVSLWVVSDAFDLARAEYNWSDVRALEPGLRNHNWQGEDNDYARLLIAASRASELRPGDIHFRHWLNFYRWKSISRRHDPKTGELILDEQQLGWSQRVVAELLRGLWRCPSFGPSYSLAGQIEKNVLGHPEGARLIRTGYQLSKTDPAANFEAAILDAQEGKWEPAMVKFEHAAGLLPNYLTEGVEVLCRDLHRPDMALQLADQDVPAVRRIIKMLDEAGDAQASAQGKARLSELIKAHAAPPDAPSQALIDAARLATSEGDHAAAIALYRRALNLNDVRADWRLEMARALAARGDLQEAMDEARVAQRLGSSAASGFILELRLRPATQAANPK